MNFLHHPTHLGRHVSRALALAAALAAAGSVMAQPAPGEGPPQAQQRPGWGDGRGAMHGQHGPHAMGEHGPRGGMGMQRMLKAAGATAEQQAKIESIYKAAHSDIEAQRGDPRAARQRMMALLAAPTLDRAAIEAEHRAQTDLRNRAGQRMLQATIDAAAVLTPEQRARVAERMSQRGERGGPRGGEGRGPAPARS